MPVGPEVLPIPDVEISAEVTGALELESVEDNVELDSVSCVVDSGTEMVVDEGKEEEIDETVK